MDVLATYAGRKKDGALIKVEFAVSEPIESADGDWYCRVLITGPTEFKNDIYGADAWQALTLGIRFIKRSLEHFAESGGRLLHTGSEEEVAIHELFP